MSEWQLDLRSGVPLYLQLKQKIIQKIIEGTWPPGHQLPTVRQMAADVKINVNTVARVYNEVEREGYIRTQQGKGTFVREPDSWWEKAKTRESMVGDFAKLVRDMANAQGISLNELIQALKEAASDTFGTSSNS